MSGKAKTAAKGDSRGRGPNDVGFKHEKPNVELVLEFRRNARGNVAPKRRFRKVGA